MSFWYKDETHLIEDINKVIDWATTHSWAVHVNGITPRPGTQLRLLYHKWFPWKWKLFLTDTVTGYTVGPVMTHRNSEYSRISWWAGCRSEKQRFEEAVDRINPALSPETVFRVRKFLRGRKLLSKLKTDRGTLKKTILVEMSSTKSSPLTYTNISGDKRTIQFRPTDTIEIKGGQIKLRSSDGTLYHTSALSDVTLRIFHSTVELAHLT